MRVRPKLLALDHGWFLYLFSESLLLLPVVGICWFNSDEFHLLLTALFTILLVIMSR
jgi:hypothetical protein